MSYPARIFCLSVAACALVGMPSASYAQDSIPSFEAFDADSSNGINRTEFIAGGRMTPRQFNDIDVNNDESISLGEYNTFETRTRTVQKGTLSGDETGDAFGNRGLSFGVLDTNTDNSVSETEFTNNKGLTEAQFEEIDVNSDGNVTLTEMNAYQTSLRSSNDSGSVRGGMSGTTERNNIGVTGSVNTGVTGSQNNNGVTNDTGVNLNAGGAGTAQGTLSGSTTNNVDSATRSPAVGRVFNTPRTRSAFGAPLSGINPSAGNNTTSGSGASTGTGGSAGGSAGQ